jgi:hypothetical protein
MQGRHSDSGWHLVLVELEEVVALEILKLEPLAAVEHLCMPESTCQTEANLSMLVTTSRHAKTPIAMQLAKPKVIRDCLDVSTSMSAGAAPRVP